MQVIERLAPLLGLLPSTLDRQFRAQRLAGQLPAGGPGGGRLSAHFGEHPITAGLLGLVGPIPSDAPEAAAALGPMPFRGPQSLPAGMPPPLPTLEDMLAHWISNIAAALRRGQPADHPPFAPMRSMEIALCLNPRSALINIVPPDSDPITLVYAAGQAMPFALRRLTILSGDLLMAAGELVADTIEQNAAIAAVQFLGKTQPAKAGPGRDAETSPKVPAPFRDQPRNSEADQASNTVEGIRQEIEFQAGLVTPQRE